MHWQPLSTIKRAKIIKYSKQHDNCMAAIRDLHNLPKTLEKGQGAIMAHASSFQCITLTCHVVSSKRTDGYGVNINIDLRKQISLTGL